MPCNSGQNLAPICFAMCFPDVYEIRIPPGTQKKPLIPDMLPSYRTMKYKSPIWGYFHVQKE